MTTKQQMEELLERVRCAQGPSEELDARIRAALLAPEGAVAERSKFNGAWCVYLGQRKDGNPKLFEPGRNVPFALWEGRLTGSIDAAVGLVERLLPGWCWKVGTRCVSDDAWMVPDWNHPEHGARLRQELGEPVVGEPSDHGFDVDRRPSGNVPLALLEALLEALIWKAGLSALIAKGEQG